jgi:hypothetical protein
MSRVKERAVRRGRTHAIPELGGCRRQDLQRRARLAQAHSRPGVSPAGPERRGAIRHEVRGTAQKVNACTPRERRSRWRDGSG